MNSGVNSGSQQRRTGVSSEFVEMKSVVPEGSDVENFMKVWQRSPVRRKKREGRSISSEIRTEGLPSVCNPHGINCYNNVQGLTNTFGSTANQAGRSKFMHKMMDRGRHFSPSEGIYLHHGEYHHNDAMKYSELKINKSKTLSLEDLNDNNNNKRGAIKSKHVNLKMINRSQNINPRANNFKQEMKRTSNTIPVDFKYGGTNKLIGSDESDYNKICDEEDKLRCLGYEIKSDHFESCLSDSNSVPPDDYLYILKKVHRRPKSAIDQMGGKNILNKQIKLTSKVDFTPDQQFLLDPRNHGNQEHLHRQMKQLKDRSIDEHHNHQPHRDWNSQFVGNNLTSEKDFLKTYHRFVENDAGRSFNKPPHSRCHYKPPKAPSKEAPCGMVPSGMVPCSMIPSGMVPGGTVPCGEVPRNVGESHHRWSNHFMDPKDRHSSLIKDTTDHEIMENKVNRNDMRKDGHKDGRKVVHKDGHKDANTTTVFGLTGYLNKHPIDSNETMFNQLNVEQSPYYHQSSGGIKPNINKINENKVLDSRRRPISSWLELGKDLEHALMFGCHSNSSDAQDIGNFKKSIPYYNEDVSKHSDEGQAMLGGSTHNKHKYHHQDHHRDHHLDHHHQDHHRDHHQDHHQDHYQESKEAVGLIFEAIDQQNKYLTQSDLLRRPSVSEAIYSKPDKRPKRPKSQDRFEDLIFLDLHANRRLDIGSCGQDHVKINKKVIRPSSFNQSLESYNDSNPLRYQLSKGNRVPNGRPVQSSQFISKWSYSLPGSRENLRHHSSNSDGSDNDYEQFTVAEIKNMLFGPHEEKAKPLLQNNRKALEELYLKNKSSIYRRSIEARPSHLSLNVPMEQMIDMDYSKDKCNPSSSDSDAVDDNDHLLNNFGQRLKLRELSNESLTRFARKDVDDMANRKYKISNTKSNPDLSQKETKYNQRIQTSYPRKTYRNSSKEKLSRVTQSTKERGESKNISNDYRSQSVDNYKRTLDNQFAYNNNSKARSCLTRRRSLCAGVAQLVHMFEKSISAPNLLDENLFANSYSETGDPLVDIDDDDDINEKCFNSKLQSDSLLKTSGNRYKKCKKTKIRLLKSSDSGYMESETDSIASSGKDCKESRHITFESIAEGNDGGTDERYDRDKRFRELKQKRNEWLNASPSQSPTDLNNFVSKKILPLHTKPESSTQGSSSNSLPYYERTCKVTSFGQSHLSAFNKVSIIPQPIQKRHETKSNAIENKQILKNSNAKGMSALVEKVTTIPVMNKAEPIMSSKFPSGFAPRHQGNQDFKDHLNVPKSQFSKRSSDRFDFSDDGNLTDCTDVTIDAILAHNRFSTLSPTSTLDCSDFEFYQTALSSLPPVQGIPKDKAIRIPVIRAETKNARMTDVEPAANIYSKKANFETTSKTEPEVSKDEKRTIKELVDTFELLLSNPFSTKPTILT